MRRFDVVIVGAGPGGLRAAEKLAGAGLSVVVLEKNRTIDAKVCGGGLTRKCSNLLALPKNLIDRRYDRIRLRSHRRSVVYESREPLLHTLPRKTLSDHQARLARDAGVEIETGMPVTSLDGDSVSVEGGERIGFHYLIGADGARSTIRRLLGKPPSRLIHCLQYDLPVERDLPELHFDYRFFGPWCLWIFPHRGWTKVGTGATPSNVPTGKLKENLDCWLDRIGVDISGARLSSGVIPFDYCGVRHGERCFLAGDAAGLAFEFNGEGIYSAILEPSYQPAISELVRKKRIQRMVLAAIGLNRHLALVLQGWLVFAPRWVFWKRILMDVSL